MPPLNSFSASNKRLLEEEYKLLAEGYRSKGKGKGRQGPAPDWTLQIAKTSHTESAPEDDRMDIEEHMSPMSLGQTSTQQARTTGVAVPVSDDMDVEMSPMATMPIRFQVNAPMEVDAILYAPINYHLSTQPDKMETDMPYSTNSSSTSMALITPTADTDVETLTVISSLTYSHHSTPLSNGMNVDRQQPTTYPNYPMRPDQAQAANIIFASADVPMRSIERDAGYTMEGVRMESTNLVRPVETDMIRRARTRLFNQAARRDGRVPVLLNPGFSQRTEDTEMMDTLMDMTTQMSLDKPAPRG